ncbi:hypothetical protein BCR43DRAFT_313952 [Syncephalastrum racemosum]|uniref:J domain-containing protein n=1 Tax=Syncephalastrum racemosum TaxID=13706 RepID=A0A1X2HB05_SYNRA|nr:hypothetical protein BCR43DRAFT_313952 [Syncephalastrum racemosum]
MFTVTLRSCRFFRWSWSHGKRHVSGGPLREKLRAIPFEQHVKAADKVFEDYHGKGFFATRVSNTGPPEETFLPFWVVSARVHTTVLQAQVGFRRMTSVYNPRTKKSEPHFETEWAWVPGKLRFTRDYSPLSYPELQVYASHKYRRGLVNKIRSNTCLQRATEFSASLLDRPSYTALDASYQHVSRNIDPFTIYPSTALRLAHSKIHDIEEQIIDEYLRNTYKADETRFLKLDVQVEGVQVSPVYYPAYIYTINYLGRHLRTFVNGSDLSVGGLKIYNWNRVALTSAVGMATLMTATGGIGWGGLSGSFWVGIVLPTTLFSLLTMYYPIISLRVRDAMRQYEIRSQAQDKPMWDSDWIGAFNAFEQEQRYRAWRSEQQQQRRAGSRYTASDTGSGQDPKGYYRTLGVDRSASTADIQSAFRGLAMKNHPDRYSDPDEKKKATAKFQEISAAYGVLRNPKKRKQYDSSG